MQLKPDGNRFFIIELYKKIEYYDEDTWKQDFTHHRVDELIDQSPSMGKDFNGVRW